MAISYNKLWKLLVDRKMSKADLRKAAGIAPNTMTRLRRDEEVTLTVLNKICAALGADIGGIPELIEVGKTGELFESGNAAQLKEKIQKLWSDRELTDIYSRNCKDISFDDIEAYTEKLMQIYKGKKKSAGSKKAMGVAAEGEKTMAKKNSGEKKLNGTVIVTYRCNARCSMCNRYKAPSKPEEEISIETIRKLPKMYFTNITGITIPESVTNIGADAFSGCTGLTKITIPAGVKTIGEYAFYNCISLAEITLSEGVETIGQYAFAYCSPTAIMLPESLGDISSNAFYGCTSLAAINVTENNASYTADDGVLFSKDKTVILRYPCAKAGTSYTISEGVTKISASAFQSCTALTAVTIPESVTTIELGAFENCTGLKEATLPNGITEIADFAYPGA